MTTVEHNSDLYLNTLQSILQYVSKTMSVLNFSQASRATGASRSTLYRYIEEGKISVVRLPNGKRGIDVTELERVFGPLKQWDTSPKKRGKTDETQENVFPDRSEVIELLRQQVELLERELTSAKEEKARLLGLLEQRLLELPGGKRRKGKKKDH